MRRWQKFGIDPLVFLNFRYQAPQAWSSSGGTSINDSMPCWILQNHKPDTFQILAKAYGQGVPLEAIYLQTAFQNDLATAPAADCSADHLPAGYSMIGPFAPLGTFLFNGFLDRNFQTTPPVYRLRFEKPADDPNG